MKTEFTIDYFINKFEAIPEERWTTGTFKRIINTPEKLDYQCCALGHLGLKKHDDIFLNEKAKALQSFFNKDTSGRPSCVPVTNINDDYSERYHKGETPKQRILNALKSIKQNENRN